MCHHDWSFERTYEWNFFEPMPLYDGGKALIDGIIFSVHRCNNCGKMKIVN